MRILAIDPGCTESAYAVYDGELVLSYGKEPNETLLHALKSNVWPANILVIEGIASYGMPVGAEVFDTVFWSGRFVEAWMISKGRSWERLYRRDVKLHLCGSVKANDSNIRQAIIDRYGGKEKAIGNKKTPGPLYGIKADVWAALAVAITYEGRKDAHD